MALGLELGNLPLGSFGCLREYGEISIVLLRSGHSTKAG